MFVMCTHLYVHVFMCVLSSCLSTHIHTHTLATLPFSVTCLTMVHVVINGTATEEEAGGGVVAVGGAEEGVETGADEGLMT